jgi:membrane-associated phospholipid phosphatase
VALPANGDKPQGYGMRPLTEALHPSLLFCAGIVFCMSAPAQVPLSPAHRNTSSIVVQHQSNTASPERDVLDAPAQAKDVEGILSRQYGRLLLKDLKHVATAPAQWGSQEWRTMGLAGAAIVGTGLLLDRPVRDAAQRHHNRGLDRAADFFEPFGTLRYSFGILGGFYLAGALNDDARAMHVAQDGLASSLIASVIITPVLKELVGRSRPREGKGATSFRPFSGNENSFPSGHATQAFAMASAIASHYDAPWVKTAAYGTAGLVGFARIYHNAHFTSDVLAGALIGTFVGNSIVSFNQQQRTSKVVFMPMVTPDATGVMVQIRF